LQFEAPIFFDNFDSVYAPGNNLPKKSMKSPDEKWLLHCNSGMKESSRRAANEIIDGYKNYCEPKQLDVREKDSV